MNRRLISLSLAVLLLLGLVLSVQAITWGELDDDDHPFVGILYFESPTGIWRCTGTLMSPTIFLTAGHCTEEFGEPNYNSWISFQPEISFPPDLDLDDDDAFRAYLDGNSDFVKGEAIPHPDYDDYRLWPNTFDVGIVRLYEPYLMDQYGQLPPQGLLEDLSRGQGRRGRQFTAVGYGLQGYLPSNYQADRTRYQGAVSLIEINSASNGDGHSAKFTNNPGHGNGSGGTCFGDSGGPIFHADTRVVGAITSWGITPCVGVDYQFRIDTVIAQEFLNQYLP